MLGVSELERVYQQTLGNCGHISSVYWMPKLCSGEEVISVEFRA